MLSIFNIFRKLKKYENYLFEDEKSDKTIKKYVRDVERFKEWLEENCKGFYVTKTDVIKYKEYLSEHMNIKTLAGHLSSLTSYFKFINRFDLIVKRDKNVKTLFFNYDKALVKSEICKLIYTAINEGKIRLTLIIEFMVNTGVRVSELQYITIEHLKSGKAYVKGKSKLREVIIPKSLCKVLLKYCKLNNIENYVFVTKTGKCIDRKNIWRDIKKLCIKSKIDAKKVFPHNLRHYFAVAFYNKTKDLDKLAHILGHSSIETTRIYTVESIDNYRDLIEDMDLPFIDMTKY